MEGLKACTVCGEDQPLSNFHKQTSQPSGLTPRCKSCTAKYQHDYHLKNRDRVTERTRQWRKANPDRAKANRKRQYDSDRIGALLAAKHWQEANRDRHRMAALAYQKTPKGRANKLRNRWHLAPSDEEWVSIIRHDPCSYCGGFGGQLDHITARALGGSHDWTNLTSACRRCNGRKSAFPLLTWLHRAHVA